jgi:hypothetical protein
MTNLCLIAVLMATSLTPSPWTREVDSLFAANTPARASDDWDAAARRWQSQLPRSVSAEDLSALFLAKRAAISAIRLQYVVDDPSVQPGADADKPFTVEFASAGGKLLRRVWDSRSPEGVPTEQSVFNGRAVQSLTSATNNGQTNWFLNISAFRSRSAFISPDNPLAVSMLSDSRADLGQLWLPYDIGAMLASPGVLVYDVVHDGQKMTVVAYGVPPGFKAYLDPKRDFSVVRLEEYVTAYDGETPRGSQLASATDFADFVDYGNGLWLPRSTVTTFIGNNGKATHANRISLVNATVNDPSIAACFELPIPDGAHVIDSVKDIIYDIPRWRPSNVSDVPSTAPLAMIKGGHELHRPGDQEAAAINGSASVRTLLLPIVACAAAVIGCWLILKQRGRRRA